jgi:hypothetical protein
MWRKNKISRRWLSGYFSGHKAGSLETNKAIREMIIKNLIADAVISTNADVRILERVVEIVEES